MSAFLLYGLLFVVVLNILMFYFAFKWQTDKLTDITYCVSFAALAIYAAITGNIGESQGKVIITLLILIWAIRLGSYLWNRVNQLGRDERFDEIRIDKKRFFRFFLIQGVSSWLISLPFLIRMNVPHGDFSFSHAEDLEWAGLAIALIGLIIEVIADRQKTKFKNSPNNRNVLYTGGLYKTIRYPNYLGEILFWIGIYIAALAYLQGIMHISVIGPIIIIVLILFVSGIPFLERGRSKKYGSDPEYQEYLKKTKKIFPFIY